MEVQLMKNTIITVPTIKRIENAEDAHGTTVNVDPKKQHIEVSFFKNSLIYWEEYENEAIKGGTLIHLKDGQEIFTTMPKAEFDSLIEEKKTQ
jgi:hypothetical protein